MVSGTPSSVLVERRITIGREAGVLLDIHDQSKGDQYYSRVKRTAVHRPHITRPQHSKRLSCVRGFSVFSSYCGVMADKRVAQVQQASSAILKLELSVIRGIPAGQLWTLHWV